MKISIVTAVLNRATTIAGAIASVQAQSYPQVEHIIQDGGSTDGTLEVLARTSGSSAAILSECDGGIYDALNRGIARATGDVIGLMHSDDVFASTEVLDKVAEALSDRHVDGAYGDLEYVSARDPARVIRHWRSGPFSAEKLARGWMPPHPTLFLRRSVFERWGTYDTSYRIAADYDAMLRWLGQGGIRLAYIPEVLVKMRLGGESNSSLRRILLKSREDYRAIRANKAGGISTLALKNLSKIGQFVQKGLN